MADPFTFHFSTGVGGAPRVMILVDLGANCPVCGYTETQRYYYGVGFHSLNLHRMGQLVKEAAQLLTYRCGQCGGPVGRGDCTQGAITYPMVEGAGTVGAVFSVVAGLGVEPQYWVRGGLSIQPQALPRWEPPVGADKVAETLTELDIYRFCGRVMQPKGSWRSLLDESLQTGDALVEPVGPSLWLSCGKTRAEIDLLISEDAALASGVDSGSVVAVPVFASEPVNPVWAASQDAGAARQWLPAQACDALGSQVLSAVAWVDVERALGVVESVLGLGQLTYCLRGTGRDTTLTEITTPREEVFPDDLSVDAIVSYAAHTGIFPEESARIASEHVVGSLMGLAL